MEDNNPTIWEDAYWNPADALQLPLNANPNPNGNAVRSDVMPLDGINTTPSTAATVTKNGGSVSNASNASGGSNTTNEMYLLYTAPGYRG